MVVIKNLLQRSVVPAYIGSYTYALWSENTTYIAGDCVLYLGIVYFVNNNKQSSVGVPPSSGTTVWGSNQGGGVQITSANHLLTIAGGASTTITGVPPFINYNSSFNTVNSVSLNNSTTLSAISITIPPLLNSVGASTTARGIFNIIVSLSFTYGIPSSNMTANSITIPIDIIITGLGGVITLQTSYITLPTIKLTSGTMNPSSILSTSIYAPISHYNFGVSTNTINIRYGAIPALQVGLSASLSISDYPSMCSYYLLSLPY